jgi:chitinase
MAQFVLDNNLDGIDVDYEVFTVILEPSVRDSMVVKDFAAINAQNGVAEAWLQSFTKQLRTLLPQGQYLLTHARKCRLLDPPSEMLMADSAVAPWLNGALYRTGAYGAVNAAVGDLIDWVRRPS